MTVQLSLLDVPGFRRSRESVRDRWLTHLRVEVLRSYWGREITMEDVRELMAARPELGVPPELHRNVLAIVLQGWDRAHDTGLFRRSRKDRNLLKIWRIG